MQSKFVNESFELELFPEENHPPLNEEEEKILAAFRGLTDSKADENFKPILEDRLLYKFLKVSTSFRLEKKLFLLS